MLRKLILLAITSGLAKKAYDTYRARHATAEMPAPRHVTNRRAVTPRLATAQPRSPVADDAT